jgi:alginate O-acetyltransferase complex protein AlgI
MLFNTIDFVIFFIVIITTLFVIKNRKFQHIFLILGSYFFFYYSSNYYITLLIFTTLWDFYLGRIMYNASTLKKKKTLFIIILSGNLGLLGFFKYADFAILQFNFLGNAFNLQTQIPSLELILPIGISFYTFHSIGYMTDVYRGVIKPSISLREYAIFITFFPQLVAGPILRAKHFLPQLREKMEKSKNGYRLRQIIYSRANLKLGITIMAFGFFKKMFIADNVKIMVDQIFENPIGLDSFTIILGTIGFGIQIYCDFSGYSDIAIGAALIMGFNIPLNFNKPYFATSPSDFWKRWHISLSSWLKDYLYVPLGGNKKPLPRTVVNLLIVMILGGLWHGASLNFIVWGLLHGSYLVIHKIGKKYYDKLHLPKIKNPITVFISIIVTQYFVFLTWIPFRVKDFDQMVYAMQKYIFWDFATENTINLILTNHKSTMIIIIIFVILSLIAYKKKNLARKISELSTLQWLLFLSGVTLTILFFSVGNTNDFIYFQF